MHVTHTHTTFNTPTSYIYGNGIHNIPNFPLFHPNTAYQFHSWNARFYYCLKKHKESSLKLQPSNQRHPFLFIFHSGDSYDIDMKHRLRHFTSCVCTHHCSPFSLFSLSPFLTLSLSLGFTYSDLWASEMNVRHMTTFCFSIF